MHFQNSFVEIKILLPLSDWLFINKFYKCNNICWLNLFLVILHSLASSTIFAFAFFLLFSYLFFCSSYFFSEILVTSWSETIFLNNFLGMQNTSLRMHQGYIEWWLCASFISHLMKCEFLGKIFSRILSRKIIFSESSCLNAYGLWFNYGGT